MAKTKTNKKLVLIVLLVLLLAVAIGYAAFSDTLTISGTANVKGAFDLQFVKDTSTPSNGCYVISSQGCTATVDVIADTAGDAMDKLTVTVTDLAYPGAGADIQAVIKNVGTIPAKVTAVTATPTGNGNAIVVSGLEQITTSHPVIQPNGTCTFDFTVMWNPAWTTANTLSSASNMGESINDSSNKYSFDLTITYEQYTTNLTVTPAHSDFNPTPSV